MHSRNTRANARRQEEEEKRGLEQGEIEQPPAPPEDVEGQQILFQGVVAEEQQPQVHPDVAIDEQLTTTILQQQTQQQRMWEGINAGLNSVLHSNEQQNKISHEQTVVMFNEISEQNKISEQHNADMTIALQTMSNQMDNNMRRQHETLLKQNQDHGEILRSSFEQISEVLRNTNQEVASNIQQQLTVGQDNMNDSINRLLGSFQQFLNVFTPHQDPPDQVTPPRHPMGPPPPPVGPPPPRAPSRPPPPPPGIPPDQHMLRRQIHRPDIAGEEEEEGGQGDSLFGIDVTTEPLHNDSIQLEDIIIDEADPNANAFLLQTFKSIVDDINYVHSEHYSGLSRKNLIKQIESMFLDQRYSSKYTADSCTVSILEKNLMNVRKLQLSLAKKLQTLRPELMDTWQSCFP